VFRVMAVRSKFKFVSTCSSGAFGFKGLMKNSVLRGEEEYNINGNRGTRFTHTRSQLVRIGGTIIRLVVCRTR
jgi:hypothetical protein